MTAWRALGALALLAASAASPAAQELTPVEAARRYDEGDFAGAREIWRALAADPSHGLDPAALHYNLGNAEFRSGRLGWATLHWERSLLHEPGNADALANLALARGILDRRLADSASSASSGESDAFAVELLDSMEGLAAGLRRAPPSRFAATVAGAAFLAGAFVTLLQLGFARRRLLGTGLVGSLAVAAAGLTLLGVQRSSPDVAVVVAPAAALRSGPGATFPRLASLPEGLVLDLGDDGFEAPEGFRRVVAAGIVGYADRSEVVPVRRHVRGGDSLVAPGSVPPGPSAAARDESR